MCGCKRACPAVTFVEQPFAHSPSPLYGRMHVSQLGGEGVICRIWGSGAGMVFLCCYSAGSNKSDVRHLLFVAAKHRRWPGAVFDLVRGDEHACVARDLPATAPHGSGERPGCYVVQ